MLLDITETPLSYRFMEHEENDLREILYDIERSTLMLPILSPTKELFISSDTGLTENGYKYSDIAFIQICGLLSPGLSNVINDLCGQWRKTGDDRKLFSGTLAAEFFNRVVKFRFDTRLAGIQLVKNTKTKIIDGIVGARYRYLSNSDFLDKTTQTLKGLDAKFIAAYLYGRQLVIRYAYTANKYNISDDVYSYGFHFANAEIGGKAARAAGLLIRDGKDECALGPFTGKDGGRVIHTGKDFEKKLYILLDAVIKRIPAKSEIETFGAALRGCALNLSKNTSSKRFRQIAVALVRRKLNLLFAKRIVAATASIGRNIESSLVDAMPYEYNEILSSRTSYDLFVTLMREAKDLPIAQRELVEQAAYDLLMGKYWV